MQTAPPPFVFRTVPLLVLLAIVALLLIVTFG